MSQINLLPWRENNVTFKNRIFASISIFAAVCCLILMFLLSIYVKHLASQEIIYVSKIKTESGKLEELISEIKGLQEQKKLLLARRDVIESLQASRPFIVKVFEGISKAVPNGLYLQSMNRVGSSLTIRGFSESNARISTFMRTLQSEDWLNEATLKEIKSKGNIMGGSDEDEYDSSEFQEIEFTLNVTLIYE